MVLMRFLPNHNDDKEVKYSKCWISLIRLAPNSRVFKFVQPVNTGLMCRIKLLASHKSRSFTNILKSSIFLIMLKDKSKFL